MDYPHQLVFTTDKLPVLFIIHPSQKNVAVPPHWHEAVELNYVISKIVDNYEIDGEHFETNCGRILVVNSSKVHSVYSKHPDADGSPAVLTLVFPMNYLKQCYPLADNILFDINNPQNFTDEQIDAYKVLQSLLNQLMDQFSNNSSEMAVLRIRTILMVIVTIMIDTFSISKTFSLTLNDAKQNRITQITDYLKTHYQNPISLEDISSEAHLAKEYLVRFFKASLGTTPHQYLAYIRCKNAQYDLLHSSNNLTQIAIKNGFGSLRSMNRTFDKFLHVSAKIWQSQNKLG